MSTARSATDFERGRRGRPYLCAWSASTAPLRALLAALLCVLPCSAQDAFSEPRVKAALLFNFAKFVEWPAASSDGPLTICSLGADEEIGEALQQGVHGKLIGDRKVQTRHFSHTSELQVCHVLFIQMEKRSELDDVLEVTGAAPVLTVGDGEQFTRDGGMIGIFLEGRKPRFEINLSAARDSGLRIRVQLLRLASNVRGAP